MSDPKEKLEAGIRAFCSELGIDREVYLNILAAALSDMIRDTSVLCQAASNQDVKTIQEISHRLKGTSANLRLNDIIPLATELNEYSKLGTESQRYESLSVQIDQEVKMYQQALKGAQSSGS